MLTKILFFIMTTTLFAEASIIDNGINYYNQRSNKQVNLIADKGNISKAISIFETQLNTKNDKKAAIYLIKSYYFMGQYVSLNDDDKIFYFDLAMTLCKQYMYKYPESVEILYWYLATMSNWAKTVGVMAITKMGGGEEFREKAVDVIMLDPEYENGGGFFLLGAVYHTAPYIPLISSWPDNKKSIKYFQKAVNTGIATPLQQLYLAKALIEEQDIEQAKNILIKINNMIPNPDNLIEDLTYIEQSKILLNKISKK